MKTYNITDDVDRMKVGKTDIYDVEELRQKFDRFIIYQYYEY